MKKRFLVLCFLPIFLIGCGASNRVYSTSDDYLIDSSSNCDSSVSNSFFSSDFHQTYSFSTASSDAHKDNNLSDTFIDNEPSWKKQINEKIDILKTLQNKTNKSEIYLFFTDPHCFLPTRDNYIDVPKLQSYFEILNYAFFSSSSQFVVCGGDLLNNADTKSQALFKVETFLAMMRKTFEESYYLVGNHDTNYQGDTYIDNGDWVSCMLDQKTINDSFFNGDKSYYSFDTFTTKHYCFDSGIEWGDDTMGAYRWEQIDWFANDLLLNDKPHISLYIHMALNTSGTSLSDFATNIGTIISAFNSKTDIILNTKRYDFSKASGTIEYVQSGHNHKDILGFLCGGIPLIVTTSFSSPEAVSRPTFDIVFSDYSNSKIHFLRIGDGEDRTVNL